MNFRNIAGIIALGALLGACADKMNYKEYTTYDEDYVFDNFDNTMQFVTNIYAKLDYDYGNYGGAMLASASDESEYAYKSSQIYYFSNGAWGPTQTLSGTWTTSYQGIRAANFFLQASKGRTYEDHKFDKDYASQMNRFRRYPFEVRFLRAYFYFNLAREYGNVPMLTDPLPEDEANRLPMTPAQDVFSFIAKECDAIADSLPVDYSTLSNDNAQAQGARATRQATLALKARAMLYAASPLFNTSGDKELWHKAALANKAVLDSCASYGIALTPVYADLWGENNYTNREVIFTRRYGWTNWIESYNFPKGVEGGNSGNCPTQNMVDAYEMQATGKAYDEAGSGYNPEKPYEGRDPRFYASIATNGETNWPSWNPKPLETYMNGANGLPLTGATPTGYYLKKLLNGNVDLRSGYANTKCHTWVTYRLGEFYLNYAEAVFNYLGSADATSPEFPVSAREAVDKIRERAGMPDFPLGMSNADFKKKYENERMVELAFEGHRFWDLRRWKEGDKLKSITEMRITKNADGSLTYKRQVVNRQWDDKMYFFPIATSELLKDPNLKQTPGWPER